MISDLKHTFNYSFFQEISDEWLFWEWNDEKTIFYFTLTPELFEKYSNKEKHIYWYDYHPWFIDNINNLIDLWVIESYKKISTIEYNKEEKDGRAEYFYNNWNSISENFFYYYKMEGWMYELHYNLEKLNLFKEIIHDNINIKLNIKKQLFKTILYFIDKRRFDFHEGGGIDIFDIEIILEELDIKEDIYIFNNITLLLYSICSLQDRLYIARLLNYLVNNFKWSDKETIINSIKWDINLRYYSNEEFDESDNAKLELENTHHLDVSIKHYNNLHKSIIDKDNIVFIWNIWYKNIKNIIDNDNSINTFLNKINKLKEFEKEKCLKTKLEQELIVELRWFNYKDIISDEIILLKIEKLLSHPQTIWADRRWFSISVSPYILDWEKLYNEIIWKNKNLYENTLINNWKNINIQNVTNIELKERNNCIKISENIFYYYEEYLFKNTINNLDYNIKWHWDYDKLMDLLIKERWEYVLYNSIVGLKTLDKKWDTRTKEKRITDIKRNLIENVKNNLKLESRIEFILVSNWLKLV